MSCSLSRCTRSATAKRSAIRRWPFTQGVVTEELIRAHAGGPAPADFEVCNREAAVKTVKLIQTFPVSACERMAVCYAERSDGRPSS
jgi:hypothetical protein